MTMTADIQGPRGPRYSGTAFATLMLPAASSRMLAEITGGRSDANRFPTASVAADHIEQASRFAYLLGYYPTNAAWNGRFRNIEVRIDRKDVTVLVRRGYYARPNVGPLDRERVVSFGRIAAAAGDAREIPDLGLEATADNSRTGDGRVVRLAVTIDVARVFFAKADDRNTATLEIAAFCLDGRQRGVGDVRTTIALELSDARLREVRESGVPVSLTIPVSAQADSLKLVVYDYAADLTGSRNVDVD
jgi:hypothetical protein